MRQKIFETREKADQMLRDALAIWRQSDRVDALEGIEKDPVFSLLMMALAYQSAEADSEVERLKAEVLDEFARMMVPYEQAHPIPASAVVETALQDNLSELTLNDSLVFRLGEDYPFIPLLATRILNAEVHSIVRLDGRRWKVSLRFQQPVSDLSGFAFAVKDMHFRNLSVTLKGQPLPLIKPWHYSELPFTECFRPESLAGGIGPVSSLSSLPMDLFATQNLRYFIVQRHNARQLIPEETDRLELVFEFRGLPEDFDFDKDCLILNPVILVNAQVEDATLSNAHPVARLAGSGDPAKPSRQFLHLVSPPESQRFGGMDLELRGVAGDRFNPGSLLRLLNCVLAKYHSDFYAFQEMEGTVLDDAVRGLETSLRRLREGSLQASDTVSGVYLMPRGQMPQGEFSINVQYLTTDGAAANAPLVPGAVFTPPSGIKDESARIIAEPVPGTDGIEDAGALASLARYYVVTSDRIVTMADIKAFCYKELRLRYGIESNLVRRFVVNRRLQQDSIRCGYDIVAEITLAGNSFVNRTMAGRLPTAEYLMEKMIEVRSANIYPVHVSIMIEEQ